MRIKKLITNLKYGLSAGILLTSASDALALSVQPPETAAADPSKRARLIYSRVTGLPAKSGDPIVMEMEKKIQAGQIKEAALQAAGQPGFINLVMLSFGAKLNSKGTTLRSASGAVTGVSMVPIHHAGALAMGLARDKLDFREILTGKFLYRPDLTGVTAPQGLTLNNNLFYTSNAFFEVAVKAGLNWNDKLVKEDQMGFLGAPSAQSQTQLTTANPVALGDRAVGVYTTPWGAEMFSAGTNRRMYQFTFELFACMPIDSLRAPATTKDQWIRTDVTLSPDGNPVRFEKECATCHVNIDPVSTAGAYYDGFGNQLDLFASNPRTNRFAVYAAPTTAPRPKYDPAPAQGAEKAHPTGWVPNDDSWHFDVMTPAIDAMELGASQGKGLREFAQAVANSKAFRKCMTSRMFREICRRDPVIQENAALEKVSDEWAKKDGYQMHKLAASIAAMDSCTGRF